MPTTTATREALSLPQTGGPEVIVDANDLEAFQALQVLTAEEKAADPLVAAVFSEDAYIAREDRLRVVTDMAKVDQALRGEGEPVIAEVNYLLQAGMTGKKSRLVVQPTNRAHERLTVTLDSLHTLSDGLEEDHTVGGRRKPRLISSIPGVALTEYPKQGYPEDAISEAIRCANNVLVVGKGAVDGYLQLRAEKELGEEESGMYFCIPYSQPEDEAGKFAASSTLWAAASLAESGFRSSLRYDRSIKELGTGALALIVAGSAGVRSDASDPQKMANILQRLPAVDLTRFDIETVAEKASAIVRAKGAYDALSGTAARNGSDMETMMKTAAANTMQHLVVGIEAAA